MIHHIALAHEWDAAQQSGFYDRSTLDVGIDEVGFVHASDSYEQAARVLRYVFTDVDQPMALLSIEPDTLAASGLRVVHEAISPRDPSSEHFPHIYGGPIPVGAVSRVQHFDAPDQLMAVLERGERADADQPQT